MLQTHPDGVLLLVRAQPGARKAGVQGVHAGRLKVAVHAAAEKGKANDALVEVLADALGIKRSQVQLVRGSTSQDKVFLITHVTMKELERKVSDLLAGS
jgi:uncharacterized protein (TIGR00251 family)